MRAQLLHITFITFWLCASLEAQPQRDLRLMFYNTENLFDTYNDPHTNDDDFTPSGKKHWTKEKYNHKLQNISKVIISAGEWSAPDAVGICEIETRQVLTDLIKNTPLSKIPYDIVHYESPDKRGIDVAIIYRTDRLKLLRKKPFFIHFETGTSHTSRNILMAQFAFARDTFYYFINHWPSRVGGEIKSEPLREEVAARLKEVTDSIFRRNPNAKMVITGDFNDEPDNESITQQLQASLECKSIRNNKLYNISSNQNFDGSMKYRGRWYIFDQMIVSGALLKASKGLSTQKTDYKIFAGDFMLESDEKQLGKRLIPTYSGPKYIGGYSDHLPVYLDLFIKK